MQKAQWNKKQESIFLLIVALFWFAQYVYIPYQTTYLLSINVGVSTIGVIIGAYGIAQLLLRMPTGVCADRIGRHKGFIRIGAVAAGLASIIRILMCNEIGFFVGNILSGLASAMWISYMVFYTSHYDQGEQRYATGRIIMFNNGGMLLGFLASTICFPLIGMRGLCMLSAAAGLLGFVLAFTIKEASVEMPKESVANLLSVCLNKRLIVFALAAIVQQGIQLTTTMSFTNQILMDLGATTTVVGIASIIYMVAAVLCAKFSSSAQCSKRPPQFWICSVFTLLAIYCIAVPVVGSIPLILLLQILPGIGTGILFAYLTSEAMMEVPQSQKSTAMGFFQAMYAIGMTTFPVIVSGIAEKRTMVTGYFFLACLALCSAMGIGFYYIKIKVHKNRMNECSRDSKQQEYVNPN